MTKYRIKKIYTHVTGSVLYDIHERFLFIFWIWVDYRDSRESAERLIKLLEDEGL